MLDLGEHVFKKARKIGIMGLDPYMASKRSQKAIPKDTSASKKERAIAWLWDMAKRCGERVPECLARPLEVGNRKHAALGLGKEPTIYVLPYDTYRQVYLQYLKEMKMNAEAGDREALAIVEDPPSEGYFVNLWTSDPELYCQIQLKRDKGTRGLLRCVCAFVHVCVLPCVYGCVTNRVRLGLLWFVSNHERARASRQPRDVHRMPPYRHSAGGSATDPGGATHAGGGG